MYKYIHVITSKLFCIAVTCQVLSVPGQTDIVYSPLSDPLMYNAIATHTCVYGYTITSGDTTRTCTAFNMWSGQEPTCQRMLLSTAAIILICVKFILELTCNVIAIPADGSVVYSPDSTAPYDFGTTVSVSCDSGFVVMGDETRACEIEISGSTTADWTGTQPLCTG